MKSVGEEEAVVRLAAAAPSWRSSSSSGCRCDAGSGCEIRGSSTLLMVATSCSA